MQSDYLEDLNAPQRAAVESIKGPSLVIAGAGSGKTRVLTFRIAHLLRLGNRPSGILSLTFTNKAAKEMKERISQIVGQETARYLWMGTFHSIFSKILRAEAEAIGFQPSFTIYDTQDAKNLIKTIVKELHLDDQIYKPNDILGRISKAKNNLITPKAYEGNVQAKAEDAASRRPEISRIYGIYAQRCKKSVAMDFDDLLLYTNILFRDHPQILEKYQRRFEFILVDEYQDTNYAQYLIVKKLAARHHNICVVGDDAQSIYAFRGAKIENILNFKKDYKDFKMFKLEQNYRSTQNIVEAANSIIDKNTRQIKKNVYSENEVGKKIKILQTASDKEEASIIANDITDTRLTQHFNFLDYAILYRTNAQSRVFEESLRRRNIPYKIHGGLSFYQRKEIKDLLSYCRLVGNHSDEEAFKRVINYPKRGIGNTTVSKLAQLAAKHQISLWEVAANLQRIECDLNAGTRNKITKFVLFIDSFAQRADAENAYDIVFEMAKETGILKELSADKTPEGLSRHENIQELLNGIKDFTQQPDLAPEDKVLDKFLQDVALLTNQDNEKEEDRDKVVMMTIHSSKGLEFKNVYIVGMEEGLFPSQFSAITPQDLEEERRLFYVAVTRAEKNLTISSAGCRYKWGNLQMCQPSRFITDIDLRFLDIVSSTTNDGIDEIYEDEQENFSHKPSAKNTFTKRKFKPSETNSPKENNPELAENQNLKPLSKTTKQRTALPASDSKLVAGAEVEHIKFGYGKILKIEGKAPNQKATVFFQNAGQKQLLLKFARLKILS